MSCADAEREELWAESVRRHNEQQRQENLIRDYLYRTEHIGRLRRTLDTLIAGHADKRRRDAEELEAAYGIRAETLLGADELRERA